MPHGETWFSLLPFYHSLQAWISKTFGPTWLEHTETLKIQPIFGFAAVVLTLVIAGFFIRRRLQRPEDHILPEGRVTPFSFIEMLVSATYNMMKDVMGPQAIFFSNVMGLLPGFLPPTDNLSTNFAMAIVIFFATHVYGVREHGFFRYFRHFAGPPLPIAIAIFIYPLMFVIETISHIVRPVTLAVRLMANMTADHMVLGIFVAAFAAGAMGISLFWLPVPVAFYLLGCLVVVVQTLVFCLLATIYIALAIQHEEGH